MKRVLFLLIALFALAPFGAGTLAQDARRFIDLSKVPAEGTSPQEFVPPGWRIENQIEGDVDRDAKADVVLELLENLPEEVNGVHQARYRALLVLTRAKEDRLRLAAAADRILRCTTCFGLLSTSPRITIVKGVIIVNHLYGSRDAVDYSLRFRYEPELKRFLLIGEDIKNSDRATGKSTLESINFLTGNKIIESYQFDLKEDRDILVSQNKKAIPKTKTFLERIDYEDY